jgi:hypothetical protein
MDSLLSWTDIDTSKNRSTADLPIKPQAILRRDNLFGNSLLFELLAAHLMESNGIGCVNESTKSATDEREEYTSMNHQISTEPEKRIEVFWAQWLLSQGNLRFSMSGYRIRLIDRFDPCLTRKSSRYDAASTFACSGSHDSLNSPLNLRLSEHPLAFAVSGFLRIS